MPTARKSKTISTVFSPQQIAAARASAAQGAAGRSVDWRAGTVTMGGGVAATIGALRRARGKNKNPTKEQVAIRFDPEVLAAFRANGPGWQTRMNNILKQWLAEHQAAPRGRRVAPLASRVPRSD